MLYCAMGYSEDAHVAANVNTRYALGYYGYPVDRSMARPLSLATDPAEYQRAVNRHDNKGFTEIARRYLYFSRQRERLEDLRPWLPYIQTHSNLYLTNPPEWWDEDELREPTSAEFRYQCNIALAFGADGAVLYSFVSSPAQESADPFWPPSSNAWEGDPDREIDEDCGVLGFLDRDLAPRNIDWNGEPKFDLAAAFINGYLMPVGNLMKEENLEWKRGRIWHLRNHQGVDAGENQWVSQVLSFHMNHPTEIIDSSVQSYVLVSEFEKTSTNERYLYVVNGRTHREEGDRHIAVLLGTMGGAVTHWEVHNLITKDTWIIRAIDTDDSTNVRGRGFTDYFRAGEGALYRIKPTSAYWSDPLGLLIPGNLFVSEQATLELDGTSLTFRPG
ncbi:MAG: hypothetical protein IH628_14770, partial [Proteobacteria bacterium]|nr:hypothetical protein [Pseudomonadota bacterium]